MAFALSAVWTGVRLGFLSYTGIPEPLVHDEFSYLLGGDTFAHGKLVNPPHPLGKFFESPHELARPVYASKYPPGQALFLAFGQRFLGSPFFGVILSNAAMLFAICVALCAWVPIPWASAVSIMLAAGLMPPMYWTNSYWGGSVAATGGALILIAIGFLRKAESATHVAIFCLGAALLFFTRPFEGAIFTAGLVAAFWMEIRRHLRWKHLLSAAPVLLPAAAFTLSLNYSVSGSYWKLPYIAHDRQYNVTPPFWFLSTRAEPAYSHARLAAQHGLNGKEYKAHRAQQPWSRGLRNGLETSLAGFFAPFNLPELSPRTLLMLCTGFGFFAWKDPVYARLASVAALCLLTLGLETWHFPHYLAPVWAVVAVMTALPLQRIWKFRSLGAPIGTGLTMLILVFPAGANLYNFIHSREAPWTELRPAMQARRNLITRLNGIIEPQLVIVRYPYPAWNVSEEWVYNNAGIDAQHVVFAHDFGPTENVALFNYYPRRQVKLLTLTGSGYILTPYGGGASETVSIKRPAI